MLSLAHVVGWLIVYTIIAVGVSRKIDNENVKITGPFLTIYSQKGLGIVEKLSEKYPRFWRFWGNLGVASAYLAAVAGLFFVGTSVLALFQQPENVGLKGPTDALVIPGVNRFIPLSAAPELIFALALGIVIHEGGHAIFCRVGDIPIESTGVSLLALIPLGAFVEPDEEEQLNADIPDQLRMYAAGIMNNFLATVICVLLIFVLTTAFVSPVLGLGVQSVFPGSPADKAGIESGDVITGVNGNDVNSVQEFANLTSDTEVETVEVNGNRTVNLTYGAFISKTPKKLNISAGDTVVEVNGQKVTGRQAFYSALRNSNSTSSTVKTSAGDEYSIPNGAYVVANESTGIAESMGLEKGESTFIYSVNNQRVYNAQDVQSAFNNSSSELVITYGDAESPQTITYSNTDNNMTSTLIVSQNTGGISTSVLGVKTYPAESFHGILTFGDSVVATLQNAFLMMFLPIGEITFSSQTSFSGFTQFAQNFYTVSGGPLFTWFVYNTIGLLFWTAWLNFNLGLFNCLPTALLDGGHILRATSQYLFEDIVGEDNVNYVVRGVQAIVGIAILMIFIYPAFL